MAARKRTPHEVKEIGVKKMVDSYQEINRKSCPPEKVKEFVQKYEREILPKMFDRR